MCKEKKIETTNKSYVKCKSKEKIDINKVTKVNKSEDLEFETYE